MRIKKGLDIPLAGGPKQVISSGQQIKSVALVGEDYVGMKPTMLVQVGDKVLKGQPLFEDKKTPGVIFTSPAEGTVREINRGERRVFQSVVISVEGHRQINFKHYQKKNVENYTDEEMRNLLIESGLWTALRTRPFSKTPAVDSKPVSIFVTVMDTRPLAADPEVVMNGHLDDFHQGVLALSKLAPKVYVVTKPNSQIKLQNLSNVIQETFTGPHPSGNVGTHIHFLDPVSESKTVWHLNYQDVLAIGHLLRTGILSDRRVISLAGPSAKNPRLVETVRGASLADLTNDEYATNEKVRVISGSVLGGRIGAQAMAYLGAFHHQVTLLEEGGKREFLGWQDPGPNKFSFKRVVLGSFLPGKKFAMDTSTNGSLRSIVPIGAFEAVVPMDILPTPLLRFLMAQHTDYSVSLGALELDEEDLALCTYVDPCKNEYGPVLRQVLDVIEKEG